MNGDKLKISLLILAALIMGIAAIYFISTKTDHKEQGAPSTVTGLSQAAKDMGITVETTPTDTQQPEAVTLSTEAETKAAAIALNAVRVSEGLPPQSPTAAVATVNPVPTDEEIIASIKRQDQQKAAMEKMLASRKAQADRIIEQVKTAPAEDPSKSNTVVTTVKREVAPGDIIEKLKSNTLVAH